MILIGSARKGETGYTNQKVGDQSGNEVVMQEYYNHKYGWDILRPVDDTVASKLNDAMKNACNNNHIGYSQSTRNTLINAVAPLGYDVSKLTVDVNCDCSSLVRVCVIYALGGLFISDFTTANEKNVLLATGKFRLVKEKEKNTTGLRRGDILVSKRKGHTAIVVTSNITKYIPPCDKNCNSIVDGLKSVGIDSTLKNRKLIASENGISTSDNIAMNVALLKLLKNGTLKNVGV